MGIGLSVGPESSRIHTQLDVAFGVSNACAAGANGRHEAELEAHWQADIVNKCSKKNNKK